MQFFSYTDDINKELMKRLQCVITKSNTSDYCRINIKGMKSGEGYYISYFMVLEKLSTSLKTALSQINAVDVEIKDIKENVWGISPGKTWLRVEFDTRLRSKDEFGAIYAWLHEFCKSNFTLIKHFHIE